MNNDLKIIKKNYGEKMMHLCREMFPTILERPGLLSKILLDHFNPSRFLYDDITVNKTKKNAFKNYINSFVGLKEDEVDLGLSVSELMDRAGYEIYECTCEEDIQKFKKYYATGEELCTFWGNRLNYCYVFFAVKKNVDDIKREDFLNPSREDEYGTSVISIQFSKGEVNTLSIKNRYNHKVANPDATFSNNLENIIPGLTRAFVMDYNLRINQNDRKKLYLDNYVLANDGKYYKYNYEINNVYYCPDNIIIDNFNVKKYDRARYIIMDYFIIDSKEKCIKMYEEDKRYTGLLYRYNDDSFCNYNNNIKKINISNIEDNSRRLDIITTDGNIEIVIDKYNRMISYKNDYVNEIGDNFLLNNKYLLDIELPKVNYIGDRFLRNNIRLKKINISKVESIGEEFLYQNNCLKEVTFPNLIIVKDDFMKYNNRLSNVYMPSLMTVGNEFLFHNRELTEIRFPNLKNIGDFFLGRNEKLMYAYLPSLRKVGAYFLEYNNKLKELDLPKVKEIDYGFMYYNSNLKKISVPNIEIFMEDCSLRYNIKIKEQIIRYMNIKRRINGIYELMNNINDSVPSEIIDNVKRRILRR